MTSQSSKKLMNVTNYTPDAEQNQQPISISASNLTNIPMNIQVKATPTPTNMPVLPISKQVPSHKQLYDSLAK